jgi:hypothetical protein
VQIRWFNSGLIRTDIDNYLEVINGPSKPRMATLMVSITRTAQSSSRSCARTRRFPTTHCSQRMGGIARGKIYTPNTVFDDAPTRCWFRRWVATASFTLRQRLQRCRFGAGVRHEFQAPSRVIASPTELSSGRANGSA